MKRRKDIGWQQTWIGAPRSSRITRPLERRPPLLLARARLAAWYSRSSSSRSMRSVCSLQQLRYSGVDPLSTFGDRLCPGSKIKERATQTVSKTRGLVRERGHAGLRMVGWERRERA